MFSFRFHYFPTSDPGVVLWRDVTPTTPGASVDPTGQMMKYFSFEHLPVHLQAASKVFATAAEQVVELIPPGPERTVCLRKLLEAKDCGVRASL